MEDLFDDTRDRWQRSYRHPMYLRLLWIVGVAIVVAAVVFRARIRDVIASNPLVGWLVVGAIAFLAFSSVWTSIRAWESKILISPTSIKAWYLFRGRERISWDSMDHVSYKWRLLGHTLILHGTDGARVRVRSAITGYDEIVDFVRAKAPQYIVDQIDDLLGEEQDAENEEPEEPAEADGGQPEDETEPTDEPQGRNDDATP